MNLNLSQKVGFWGNRTATIDWCEINYEVTHYIAEFWNTVSNLVLILFPLYGFYWSLKHTSYSKKYSNNEYKYFSIPYSVMLCHLGLVIVGIGSWMFHMTLLYPMQLLDELPMIFGSGILIFANYDLLLATYKLEKEMKRSFIKETFWEKFFYNKILIFSLIMTYSVLISFVYLYIWTNPIFHELSYSLMTIVIIGQNVSLIKRLGLAKRLYLISFVYYMFGFFLWNIDNNFCEFLRFYRSSLDNIFSINESSWQNSNFKTILINMFVVSLKSISEFHSLWHIFTGYGSFMNVLFVTEAHYEFFLKKNKKIYESDQVERPVSAKLFNMYYHLNNSLIINEKTKKAKKKL